MHKPAFKWIVRVLVLSAEIAVAVPLLRSFFEPHVTFSRLFQGYAFALVYSTCIGIPLSAVLPIVWVRTLRQLPVVRLALRSALVIVLNFTGCLLAGLVLLAWFGFRYHFWSEFRQSFGLALVITAVAVAFVSTYEAQEAKLRVTSLQLKTNEIERERALKLASEARLSSLESRIHPHFLFNTINSISSLIHEDPQRAERILTQLAELLRFSLDEAPGRLVALAKEARVVEDYLEIEKARFGERLKYELRVPVELEGTCVPPLSLQTLVENSVKYAVSRRGRGATVLVNVSGTKERLCMEVRDNGPGFAHFELPAGHGLSSLQERLTGLFGESAKLTIASGAEETTVTIDIPSLSMAEWRSSQLAAQIPEASLAAQS